MAATSDPSSIERDLDETRSRLGSHLDELQDKLSPGQVLDDLMSYFKGTEGAAFGQNLIANIRANPMPAAITGVGLAWLMASNPPGGSTATSAALGARQHHYGRDDHQATITRVREAEDGVTRDANEPETDYSARLESARGHALGLARHAQETAESFGQRVKDALSSAQSSVMGTAHDLGGRMGDAANAAATALGSIGSSGQSAVRSAQGAAATAGEKVSQGGQAAGQMGADMVAALVESPVLLGALGLAAGALLGALLPQSDQEEAALGGLAKQARDAASGLANQGLEGGKHVAQAVVDKARESAGGHNLSGSLTPGQILDAALTGDLAKNASAVVKDALKSGEDAVKSEMSKPRQS